MRQRVCANGVMSHSGPCFRCAGKGVQNLSDRIVHTERAGVVSHSGHAKQFLGADIASSRLLARIFLAISNHTMVPSRIERRGN